MTISCFYQILQYLYRVVLYRGGTFLYRILRAYCQTVVRGDNGLIFCFGLLGASHMGRAGILDIPDYFCNCRA